MISKTPRITKLDIPRKYLILLMDLFVEDVARKIESMEIRGAHRIAQAAAKSLVQWAESSEEPINYLDANVKRLISTRPTAVSLRNALVFTLTGVDLSGDQESKERKLQDRAGIL